jgi:hypothetical protein
VNYDSRSLLTFLDSPVVVGDPEGRAVYANPAFCTEFEQREELITGKLLSEIFEGGGREAVLRAVAEVCTNGRTTRFRVRQGDVGFAALASPITSNGAHVGVLVLLTEEAVGEERLLAFHREIQDPLDDLEHALMALMEQTGGRRAERYRSLAEDGLRAHSRLRKWSANLHALLCGYDSAADAALSLDPVRSVREAVDVLRRDLETAGVSVELLVPAQLPRAKGDPDRFQSGLVGLLRDRMAIATYGTTLTLAAKAVGGGDAGCVLISLVEPPGRQREADDAADPTALREFASACGGSMQATADPVAGRTTAIVLPVAS